MKKSIVISVIISLIVGFLIGYYLINPKQETICHNKLLPIDSTLIQGNESKYTIHVRPVLVYNSWGDYVTEGSNWFVIAKAGKGYQITAKNNKGIIISKFNCPADRLDYYIELTKYKLSVRDSIIQ